MFLSSKGGKGRVRRPYGYKHHSLHISTPELLDPSCDSETDSCFKLHKNLSTTCFDVVDENWQDSAYVLVVDNLEERDVRDPERSEAFGSDPATDSEADSRFGLHQNVSTTCFDVVAEGWQDSAFDVAEENWQDSAFDVAEENWQDSAFDVAEENWQDSAYVLDVDNLDERDVRDPERWIRHYCNSHNMLLLSEAFGSDPSSDSETDCSFRLHQNVSTICFDIEEENWQDSAYALDVDNWEESDSAYALNVDYWEESDVLRGPERWIRHYCGSHEILLVGEGDFSFSASLARAFGSATNMVATSLDSTDFLLRNYKNAMSNIQELKTRGCMVLHGVDATEMANHYYLGDLKFDRVIYNFPHAGFRSGESRVSQMRRHQLLISLFFENAKEMIHENGEIHVTHKSNGFFLDWNLRGIASAVGLRLIQEVPFNFTDYPGYRTKYGFGGDKNFNCNPSKTYIFGLFPAISVSP